LEPKPNKIRLRPENQRVFAVSFLREFGMRILVFSWKDITHPWAGGSEVNIHEQAKRWAAAGHEVTMFSPSYPGAKKSEFVDGVKIVRAGGRFSVYAMAPLYYIFKLRRSCDVIVDIENGIPFFTPLFSTKPKVTIMHHVHKTVFAKQLPFPLSKIGEFLESMIPLVYRNVPFITGSENSKSEMVDILHMKKHSIRIIYNGLNHDKYRVAAKKAKNPVIVYFGRLMRYKNLDTLMRIFTEVIKQLPEAELWIAGTGETEAELRELAKKLNIENKVRFFGRVSDEDSAKILKSAWVFATCSKLEGWGITVLEGAACGTPAVAYNVSGLKESVQDNQTGLLAEDDADFADKLRILLRDKKLREKLSKQAIAYAKKFTWDNAAEQSLRLLLNEK